MMIKKINHHYINSFDTVSNYLMKNNNTILIRGAFKNEVFYYLLYTYFLTTPNYDINILRQIYRSILTTPP